MGALTDDNQSMMAVRTKKFIRSARRFAISFLVLMQLVLFASGCGGDEDQSVMITADDLGTVSGSLHLRFPSGRTIPLGALSQEVFVSCSFDLPSGERVSDTVGVTQVPTLGTVKFRFIGSESLMAAYRDSGLGCEERESAYIEDDGTYEESGLLRDEYEISMRYDGCGFDEVIQVRQRSAACSDYHTCNQIEIMLGTGCKELRPTSVLIGSDTTLDLFIDVEPNTSTFDHTFRDQLEASDLSNFDAVAETFDCWLTSND